VDAAVFRERYLPQVVQIKREVARVEKAGCTVVPALHNVNRNAG
jgi:hypothetical protein